MDDGGEVNGEGGGDAGADAWNEFDDLDDGPDPGPPRPPPAPKPPRKAVDIAQILDAFEGKVVVTMDAMETHHAQVLASKNIVIGSTEQLLAAARAPSDLMAQRLGAAGASPKVVEVALELLRDTEYKREGSQRGLLEALTQLTLSLQQVVLDARLAYSNMEQLVHNAMYVHLAGKPPDVPFRTVNTLERTSVGLDGHNPLLPGSHAVPPLETLREMNYDLF